MTDPRRFSKDVMRQAHARRGGRCKCTAKLTPGNVIYDHVIPWEISRDSTLSNCEARCKNCDRKKTFEVDIPDRHVEISRAFAAVAKKYDLSNCTVKYRPAFGDDWNDDVTVVWEQGRHGADVDKLFIESTVRVWARLPPSDQGG